MKNIIKKFRVWCYMQALKESSVIDNIERGERSACIAYNNWTMSLHKSGYPKNHDGTMMDCWQLYNHYRNNEKRKVYIHHAETFDTTIKK